MCEHGRQTTVFSQIWGAVKVRVFLTPRGGRGSRATWSVRDTRSRDPQTPPPPREERPLGKTIPQRALSIIVKLLSKTMDFWANTFSGRPQPQEKNTVMNPVSGRSVGPSYLKNIGSTAPELFGFESSLTSRRPGGGGSSPEPPPLSSPGGVF